VARADPDAGVIDRGLADVLVDAGHGMGVAHFHHMLSPTGAAESAGDTEAALRDLAAALERAGEPHAAAAILGRMSRDAGGRLPEIVVGARVALPPGLD
jgi:hypothetical protein